MSSGGAADGKNGRIAQRTASEPDSRMDLRGIKCPLNWAHAKVRLERMARGEVVELTIDDPRGARDIPQAAEAEGYSVTEISESAGTWRLRIEK